MRFYVREIMSNELVADFELEDIHALGDVIEDLRLRLYSPEENSFLWNLDVCAVDSSYRVIARGCASA